MRMKVASFVLATTSSLALTTGCAQQNDSWIETPARWGSGTVFHGSGDVGHGSLTFAQISDIVIELHDNETGTVRNLPTGEMITQPDQTRCYAVRDEQLYSGPITWEATDRRAFTIRFPGSEAVLVDNKGRIDPDWTAVRLFPCDPGNGHWQIPMECGTPYPGQNDQRGMSPCTEP